MTDEILEASNVSNETKWSAEIKKRDKFCKYCGSVVTLQAAHIVGRQCKKLKLSMLNGVALCFDCHRVATDGDKKTDEKIMRKAMVNAFGFDFYDVLEQVKYDV